MCIARREPPRQERAVVVHRRSSEEAREGKERKSHHFSSIQSAFFFFGGFVTSYNKHRRTVRRSLPGGGHRKAQMKADTARGGIAHDVVQTPSSDDTQPGADPPPLPPPVPQNYCFSPRASKSSNRARIYIAPNPAQRNARGSCVEMRLLPSPLFSPAVGDPSRLRCVHVALL